MLNAAVTNAYILYRTRMKEINNLSVLTHEQFRSELVVQLMAYQIDTPTTSVSAPAQTRSRDIKMTKELTYDSTTN